MLDVICRLQVLKCQNYIRQNNLFCSFAKILSLQFYPLYGSIHIYIVYPYLPLKPYFKSTAGAIYPIHALGADKSLWCLIHALSLINTLLVATTIALQRYLLFLAEFSDIEKQANEASVSVGTSAKQLFFGDNGRLLFGSLALFFRDRRAV